MDKNLHNEKLAKIKDLLLEHPTGLRISEISKELDITRSTVMRAMVEFENRGIFLWESPEGKIGVFFRQRQVNQSLYAPIERLHALINSHNCEEHQYQKLFQQYPWILGVCYKEIIGQQKLDDQNIPDFIGIRVTDGLMDIFEIKHPFLRILNQDGTFTADFNHSWNQAERYLDFARTEGDYLRRKGLHFDNPKCLLIYGYSISDIEIRRVRSKQRMNPSIDFLTYDHVINMAERTTQIAQEFHW